LEPLVVFFQRKRIERLTIPLNPSISEAGKLISEARHGENVPVSFSETVN
jgi:hypothetical protein